MDGSNFEAQIEPYKSDNAKLVKENNELHQQYIRTKEELDATSKGKLPVAEMQLYLLLWDFLLFIDIIQYKDYIFSCLSCPHFSQSVLRDFNI